MTECTIRVKMTEHTSIEATGMNVDEVADLINRATKKFFPSTTYADTDM